MRRITLPLIIVFMTCCYLPFANGQDQRRAQRRALVEDLLKGLIESQVDKPPRDQFQPRPTQPVQPGNRPNPNNNKASRDVQIARKHLQDWGLSNAQLVRELRHHEYEAPQLKPLLADSLELQANVDLILRRSQRYQNVNQLTEEFSVIDRDWRVLSHRLKQTQGLPTECSGFISSISDLDSQLCGLLSIQPQIDRQELQRLATKLQSDYGHLLQDVYYLVRGVDGGRELVREGQRLQSLIGQSSAMIRRGSYDDIVAVYSQGTTKWKAYSRKLSKLRDERLRRSIAEIETTGRLIHEQLWLPVEIDREYLASMANGITENANRVFDSISLSKLMSTPQPGIALTAAREFQHACVNFSNGVSSGAALEDLEWDFRLFEVQWEQIHDIYHNFQIAEVDHRLEDIQFAMDTLKQTFGDAPVMDPNMLVQLTANLDAMCRQASADVHARCKRPRYDEAFHDQICGSADSLSRNASQLHQRVLRLPNRITANDLQGLFIQWRTLKPLINQCQPNDKLALNQYRSQIEPLMVKLQVVFAD